MKLLHQENKILTSKLAHFSTYILAQVPTKETWLIPSSLYTWPNVISSHCRYLLSLTTLPTLRKSWAVVISLSLYPLNSNLLNFIGPGFVLIKWYLMQPRGVWAPVLFISHTAMWLRTLFESTYSTMYLFNLDLLGDPVRSHSVNKYL